MDTSTFILIATIYIIVNAICMKYFYKLGEKHAINAITLAFITVLSELDSDIRDTIIEKVQKKSKDLSKELS